MDELKRDEQRLRTSRDDIDSKMRDLGALGDTVGELRGVSLASLKKKLVAASREIEKTGSTVNQKAVEEFGDFVEEQKRLTTRGQVRTPPLTACVIRVCKIYFFCTSSTIHLVPCVHARAGGVILKLLF